MQLRFHELKHNVNERITLMYKNNSLALMPTVCQIKLNLMGNALLFPNISFLLEATHLSPKEFFASLTVIKKEIFLECVIFF